MQVSVSEAKARLTDLVRRAEAGDEVVLTRHGQPAVRLVPLRASATAAKRKAILDQTLAEAAGDPPTEPCAARSQDFLYDEFGLPA